MQTFPGKTGVQVLAPCVTLLLQCERFGVEPIEMIRYGQRFIQRAEQFEKKNRIAATRQYMQEQLG